MEPTRTTVRDVRRNNRRDLLSRLFFDGPTSRQELTRSTGLSAGTVSTVMAELIGEGVVVDAGLVGSDGGRPRMLLRVDPAYGHVVGVDVGETKIRVELFDLGMTARATVDLPVNAACPDPDGVANLIVDGLTTVIDHASAPLDSVLGIGIGVFGTVEQGQTTRVHAQAAGWDGVPLTGLLRERGVSLPVFIDNGVKTLGQAEMWFGAGRGSRHVVVALVGSGVGAAVITHGSMYHGATSSAAEWGHTVVQYAGRTCRCGSRGCLEAYVGAGAVLDRFHRAGGRLAEATGAEEADMHALIAAAPGCDIAASVLDETSAETAGYLGAGLATLVNLFNPERIVLGGWAGLALGTSLLPKIHAATTAHALRHPMAQTTIELCQLGPDAIAFGAATLPVADLLASGPQHRSPHGRTPPRGH